MPKTRWIMASIMRASWVVDPALGPGVAAEQPPAGLERALHQTVLVQRVDGVLRATGVVLARALGNEDAERIAVDVDERDTEVRRRPPHAIERAGLRQSLDRAGGRSAHAATLPSTSSTR